MNKNGLFFGLLISLVLLAGGVLFMSQDMDSDRLEARSQRANPVSIYIKREIKTDLYAPSDGPAPLTGWEMSGVGVSNGEGMMQTKTSVSSGEREPASTNRLQSGNRGQDRDSLTSVNRDSAASR